MIFELLHRQIRSICRSVFSFFYRSVSKAMGCFFRCFRLKDDRSRISHSTIPRYTEPVVSKNRLSALFLSEEKEESWSRGDQRVGTPQIEKGLKDEAKFLKACGILPETPAEIRKASEKFDGSPSHDKESEPSKFHSWLPNTSIKKLQLDRQCDQPLTPTKLFEECGMESASSPSSCISNLQHSGRCSVEGSDVGSANVAVQAHAIQTENVTTFLSPWVSGSNVQGKSKSVRFECDFDVSSSGNFSQNSKHKSPGAESVPKPSPNPTPLKLSDDMQTPGTVYPSDLKSLANGKSRIRSQYVYSDPVENDSQWKALKAGDVDSHQQPSELRESLEQSEDFTPMSNQGIKETSICKDLKVEASLSAWLKPPASTLNEDNKNLGVGFSRNRYLRRTPSDRPIIGMVAAHWSEEETPQVQPKWWDGNGIPNSTNKYKEDQKVSWHATPFEERLEKALSEESSISQRKNIDRNPMASDENEESDTALSKLRSSAHSKSVVSC
ncbi:protein JASON-like isoform X2 [Mangifera indica]|uniref:protein JASON-like isoform X2 n=1 Tax=Mangifera indica TaxID=29780 RepID=UPI001CFA1E68|nr:protein JASON-like isoform X2 [Mangifera indica]